MPPHRLGFFINLIAGMGGAVGLTGTDGALVRKAHEHGATPYAAGRALKALAVLAGYDPLIVHRAAEAETTARTTRGVRPRHWRSPASICCFLPAATVLRDLLESVRGRVPLLGIPCGVKIHSAVFAATPRAAADVVRALFDVANPANLLQDAEIMDREPGEDGAIRLPFLFSFVRTPQVANLVAPAKSGPAGDALLAGACHYVARLAQDERVTLLGPGSTLQRIKAELGFPGTLLGVDAMACGRLIGTDLNENAILKLIAAREARIVVTVVGGQGFLFGRGKQQLSARVIRRVGIDNIVVIASAHKLAALAGGGLPVDTGDEALDEKFAGYRPGVTAARWHALARVRSVTRESGGAQEAVGA